MCNAIVSCFAAYIVCEYLAGLLFSVYVHKHAALIPDRTSVQDLLAAMLALQFDARRQFLPSQCDRYLAAYTTRVVHTTDDMRNLAVGGVQASKSCSNTLWRTSCKRMVWGPHHMAEASVHFVGLVLCWSNG